MEITIVRIAHNPWGIDGHLYINRQRICDTVEHPTRHRPRGTYTIDLSTNPFRHGDGALTGFHGEIFVGRHLLSGVVTESQATYDRLYERLKKALQRGSTIRLTIHG